MKNPFAVFSITIFFSTILSAQSDYKATWSAPVELGENIWVNDIVYADSNGILLTTKASSNLVYFNSQLKRQYSAPLEGWQKSEDDRFKSFFQFNNKLWLFFTNYNKSDNTILYRCQEVDIPMHKVTGSVIDICSVKDSLSNLESRFSASNSKEDLITIRIIADQLNSKIAFILNPYLASQNTYKITVLNKKMRKVWEREVVIPFSESELQIYDFLLSTSGDIFSGAYLTSTIGEKVNSPEAAIIDNNLKKAAFQSVLLEIYGSKNDCLMLHMDTGDKKMTQADLISDNEGKIHIIGFYADHSSQNLNGWVEFIYDPILQKMDKSGPFPFSSNLLKKISRAGMKPLEYLPVLEGGITCKKTESGIIFFGEYQDDGYIYDAVFIRASDQSTQTDGLRIEKKQPYRDEYNEDFVSFNYEICPEKTIIIYNKGGRKEDHPIELLEWMNDGKVNKQQINPPDNDSNTMFVLPHATFKYGQDKYLILVSTRDHKQFRIGVLSKD